MTGETERDLSGWTVDTVKVLEDEKIAALERLFQSEVRRLEAVLDGQKDNVTLAASAAQEAQNKFEATVERTRLSQNEFRGALDDLGRSMATRREMETFQISTTGRLDDLAKQIAALTSRIDIGPAGLATLTQQQALQAGRREGFGVSANVLVIAATLLLTTVGLIIAAVALTH